MVVQKDTKTGVAVIMVEEATDENRILLCLEVNYTLLLEHFGALPAPLPELVILRLEIPMDTILQIMTHAKALNPESTVMVGLPSL